ncbi:MAG: hypothetical protein JWN46_1909 [Acidimicrobiales bacterium]|nr:hypothetical protein [Acidimicrobiales bacterium]
MTAPLAHPSRPPTARRKTTSRHERGAVGGIEVLPFGLLIFVVGSLLVANVWGVVDAKLAVTDAAREAARTYVEQRSRAAAERAAREAAADSILGHGRDPARLALHDDRPPFVRCAAVVEDAEYTVPALSLPFIGGLGHGIIVRARHREIIDPFADGLPGVNRCGY